MGIKLPKMTKEDINKLANDLLYTMVFHGDISETKLDDHEKLDYNIWKVEYEKEIEDEIQ